MTVTALDSRRPVLGGSTIAAAAGVDPWCSPIDLFYRLTDADYRARRDGENAEAKAWRNRMQPLIFEALRERGYSAIETPNVTVQDSAWPWLEGHPDGIVGDPMRSPNAFLCDAIVEAKLTGGYGYKPTDALPLHWQAQVQTYMHLGRVERAIVAVLVAGIRLDVHEVFYDGRAVAVLLGMAEAFVEHVREGVPPAPDGSASAREALALRFPKQEPGRRYRLTGFEWETAKQLRLLREQQREVERQITELENRVKACDPEAETFIDPYDNTFATWKEVASRKLDTKLLQAERPELADLFTRETTYRRFLVHD